ncbi:MAG: hypothetical protein Q8M19_06310 [Reyranella sp.]|nr:hypothetical protein [Reyranella sp.]
MLALLGSIVGLLGSLAPRLIGFFEQKQNHAQELEMLRTQGDFQLQMIQAGHAARMAEINTQADVATELAAFTAALKPTGVKWVDAFNGFVRPFLTLCFFALYAGVKAAQFVILQQDHSGSAATLLSMWGEEDWAVWAAIVTFWFGNRTFNKERGRG